MKFLNLNTVAFLALFSVFMSVKSSAQNGQLEVNQDPQINELLTLKKQLNTSENTSGRYSIQVYSGNRQSAEKAKTEFRNKFDQWKVVLVYEEPNYKVWVGNFKTRLEADRAFVDIQKEFPSAFIFKPKSKEKP